MKNLYSAFAVTALISAAAPVFAQSPHELEETIITASQHGKTEAEIAGSLNLIDGDELQREVGSTLGETLQNQIGVQSSSFGPGVGVPVIRGQSGKRVEVLQNSTTVADVSDTSADHAVATEALLADRIEILRGPSTLRYGTGAIGGVVNVIDSRIHTETFEGVGGGLNVRYDNNNDETVAVGKIDAGKGNWVVHVDGVMRDSDNVKIPGLADHEADDADETTDGFIENSNADARSFTLGLSWIGESVTAGFSVNDMDNDYGIPPGAHGHHDEHGDEGGDEHADEDAHEDEHGDEEEEETVRLKVDQTQYQGKLVFSNLGDTIDHIDVDFSYTDYIHEEEEAGGHEEEGHEEEEEGHEEEEHGTVFDVSAWELRTEAAHNLIPNWLGTAGLQLGNRDFVADGAEAFVRPSTTDRAGLYLIEETQIGAGTLEIGLRADTQTIEADEVLEENAVKEAVDIDHTSLNASISYLLPVEDNQRFSFIFGRSERAPVAEELLSDGEHIATNTYEIGDPDLDTEASFNAEVTWAMETGSGVSARASLFHSAFSDYIYEMDTGLRFVPERKEAGLTGLNVCSDDIVADFDDNPDDFNEAVECFLYVQEDAIFTGVEAELSFLLNDQQGIRLWGDYVRAELDDSGDVPRMPPARIGASWDYTNNFWSAQLSVVNAFDQDRPGEEQEETEGYTRLDAYLGWAAEDFSIFLKGTNLTDEEIRNSTSFLREIAPEPGRSFTLAATYKF